MAIFSQNDTQTELDFRDYNHKKPNRNVPYKLPIYIERKLSKLIKDLNLTTGSIDLIKSKNGKYYFLENTKVLAQAIRRHWTVENQLHWSLDVAFNEDRCRIKDKNAAANFAATRRFALALLKNAKISTLGIKNQRLQAAWDQEFLQEAFKFFEKVVILKK